MSSAIRGVGTVTIVNVADKTTQTLYRHRGNIGRPRWTPDGKGLLVPLDTLIADRAQITATQTMATRALQDRGYPLALVSTEETRTQPPEKLVTLTLRASVSWCGPTLSAPCSQQRSPWHANGFFFSKLARLK